MSSRSRLKLPVLALAGVMWVGACSSDDNGGGDESPPPVSQSTSAEETEASPSESAPTGESPTESEPTESGDGSASPTEPTESESGDGDSPSPEPSQSGPAEDESPTPSESPSEPSDQGGSEEATGLPPMPAAAKENSEEGAEAFARWYVETLSALFQSPQAGVIEEFSGPECGQCGTYEEAFSGLEEQGLRQVGPLAEIVGFRMTPAAKPSTVEAIVVIDQGPNQTVDANGKVSQSSDGTDGLGLRLNMHYEDGWVIDKIPTDPTAGDWIERE
ncbi:DUF6318 family protein [Kytococcus sedentarius]|uniref:DUF6318 family protein n=1 Tax=Kytococcus sedentarius TaxID=1276 RepID=UPI0035BBF414